MDIMELLMSQISNAGDISAIAKQVGANQDQVMSATKEILPALLDGLNRNAQDEKGLASLMGALKDHQNTEINNNFFDKVDLSDGGKILGHILGNKEEAVTKEVAKKSGLSQIDTSKLMMMLAPLLLSSLGKSNKKDGGGAGMLTKMLAGYGASSVLSSILGSALGTKTSSSKKTNPAEDLLKDVLGGNKTKTSTTTNQAEDLIKDVIGGIFGKK